MKKAIYIIVISFILSSCYALRAYRFRHFELKDLGKFKAVKIEKSTIPFHFNYSSTDNDQLRLYLDSNLQNSQSYSFLVIKNDSILYEKYFDKLNANNVFPSFSAAKSFVGTLAQIAHQEGKIKSFGEPVTNYLPWLLRSDKRWRSVSIQNVLDMRTGVKSDETYDNPFSDVIKLGFTKNMRAKLKKLHIESPPGKFVYKSVNTQLLAAIIEAATGEKLQDYLHEKLWQPIGMESDATWQTDAHHMVRGFCCLNATTKDFAKFGRMYLRGGNWNGVQILQPEWVQEIFNPDTMRLYGGYKNQWWSSRSIKRFADSSGAATFVLQEKNGWYLGHILRSGKVVYTAYKNMPAIFAQGLLGQFIYINPQKKLVIVRLGHNWSHPKYYAQQFIEYVAEMIQ